LARYNVAIIGGGPGGYVAAIRAAQLGLKTVVVEKDRIGGVCLNWGCIPTKALLYNAELLHLFQRAGEFGIDFDNLRADLGHAVDRSRQVVEHMVGGVEFLLQKNGVDVVNGAARLVSKSQIAVEPKGELIEADNVIVATGGVTRMLPGVEIGDVVLTSREALELRNLPQSIIIIGGGPVGVEFAYLYRCYGAEVTVVEMLDHLLPAEDEEISHQLERALQLQGIALMTGARVQELRVEDGKARLSLSDAEGKEQEVTAEKALVAVGVGGNSGGIGLEELGVAVERGFVQIDDRMQTSVPGVYAIGDVTGKLALAHVASEQGVIAVEAIAGRNPPRPNYVNMPRCTYCRPQVASCGLTEAEAQARGYQVKTGHFPFRANGKAMATAATDGLVKVVVDAEYGQVLGCHIVGVEATDLIAELALALSMEATVADVISTVHAHPTLSEAVREALLSAEGRAIHFYTEPFKGKT